MPRENRKRGKKHKKTKEEDAYAHVQKPEVLDEIPPEPRAGPSWIVSASDRAQVDAEAPFGYVDAEVKAYFRTVDLQIRDWQTERDDQVQADADVDPNEERHMFFVAALTEMSEKEKQLATDPDCSTILERMTYSMDDFVRRVFFDRLTGSLEQLCKHRFASHVFQTLLTVAAETVSRETRGIFPQSAEAKEDDGELRTMTQLVLDACEELLPSISVLVMDPFASHVIRALLVLLQPHLLSTDDHSGHPGKPGFSVRSKKSASYKARQGPMTSVFAGDEEKHDAKKVQTPETFATAATKFIMAVREQLSETEVRALAANKVASPVLQMLLEVEAGQGLEDTPDSLMDRVSDGLITISHENPSTIPESSDFVTTLLRDPTASHLLETLVRRAPENVFRLLWSTYFEGKLAKLAIHPVANFVVAKAMERAKADELERTCEEIKPVLSKIISSSRTGILRALVDRAAALHAAEAAVVENIRAAFEITTDDDNAFFVPCVLCMKPLEEYKAAMAARSEAGPSKDEPSSEPPRKRARNTANEDPLEPKTQGAVLLQSMLRLSPPHNEIVLTSIQSLTMDELLEMAHHVTSSRVLDVLLDSPSVPAKAKRTFVLRFIGHYHVLVDDRIGSRVGERCWAYADPYLKEKVARSLLAHEHFLAGSYFGKFFSRKLNLHLLQRNVDAWKDFQASSKAPAAPAPTPAPAPAPKSAPSDADAENGQKRKRKAQPQDEIDALFEETIGKKKIRRAGLAQKDSPKAKDEKEEAVGGKGKVVDKTLLDVMGAIRAAPKDDKGPRKKKAR